VSFYVESPTSKDQVLDAIMNADNVVERYPHMRDRFDAVAELRDLDRYLNPGGGLDRANRKFPDFFKVASISGPYLKVLECFKPEILKDKRAFYSWLRKNREYCTYEMSSLGAGRGSRGVPLSHAEVVHDPIVREALPAEGAPGPGSE
jgi:hypothetical protein